MTLTAGWDTKLPSNIEDTDISATSTGIANERRGLTSMSYCIFTYWVLERQRKTFLTNYGRFELSWQTNSMLPAAVKDGVVSELENGINEHFLQYCDPIKPLDVLLQLFGRLFVTSFRLRILHARVCEDGSNEDKAALINPATRTLRYNIAIQTQPSLVCFRWLTKAWFAWQACEYKMSQQIFLADQSSHVCTGRSARCKQRKRSGQSTTTMEPTRRRIRGSSRSR
jgi:hypothetical protein